MDLTFVLTHDCNLGCSYCYAGRKFRKVMSLPVRDQALELAFSDVRGGQTLRLCYFGGEPTLEWNLLIDTARLARDRARAAGIEIEQALTTNGTLLTAERVSQLAELDVYIALSIDGNREAHDAERPHMSGKSSFEDVHRGLQHVVKEGRAFETISVITPSTAHLIGKSVEYLFEQGVPRIGLNMAYEAAWDEAALEHVKRGLVEAAQVTAAHFRKGRIVSFSLFDAKIALRTGRKATCQVGEGSVAVAPGGNIYPCERLVGEDEDTTYVIGHVATGIEARPMRKHRDALPLRPLASDPEGAHHSTNDECADCGERERCSAYCACANLAETGNISKAGGVQCMFERATMEVADALFETLVAEKNATFAEWFGMDLSAPLASVKRRAAHSVAHAPKDTEKEGAVRLPVLR